MTKHQLIFKNECYKVIGICMEIHRILGRGLREIVYKDAMEYEFKKNNIPFVREKEYEVHYKDIILKHNFYADFVVYNDLVLEIKAVDQIHDDFVNITLNYISIAKSPLGLIINFGAESLQTRRVINSDHYIPGEFK
ncbi:MAG: GxxExxY protein [Saprospiraceae bacterium]